MAHTDTGLGWSANDNWLANIAGNIGTIGSGPIETLPAGFVDITELGTYTFDGYTAQIINPPPEFTGHIYCCPGVERYWGPDGDSAYWSFLYWINDEDVKAAGWDTNSPLNHITYRGVSVNSSFWAQYFYNNRPFWIGCAGGYGGDPALWHNSGFLISDKRDEWGITRYINPASGANILEMAALITRTTLIEYNKTSQGYAVACMCKWKEAVDGDVFVSPVLISTVNASTNWTANGNVPIQQLTEHNFQGMTFLMRLSKTHVDDGADIASTFPILDYSTSLPIPGANLLFALLAQAAKIRVDDYDPYEEPGTSGPGGGEDATFDFSSDDIPIPSVPSIGAYNTGFINMYKPTAGDLQSLAHYMWSGAFDLDNFKKLVASPMDAILGLHIIPATATHPTSSPATLYVGNIDTELPMAALTEQYYELDCGTVAIEPKWGAYLDYAPYSKLTLYLPYVGFVPISPDDCMGGSIKVVYHVDVLSGACCVYVYCTSNRGADSHVLYSYTGACACDCPVTEGQYTNAVLGILGIAGGVAGAITSGITGNAGGITGGITEAANAALSMYKPDISRSGNFGGSAGLMGIQYPYLVLTVPRMCIPGGQQQLVGYPSFVTRDLEDLSGFNAVHVARLETMTCTQDEAAEIVALLEKGVIF